MTSIHGLIDEHLRALVGLYQLLDQRRPTQTRLSQRELEVATLAAATPLTNKEIGARLFMAEDTVKSHLRRTFAKLGIRKRVQLQGALAQAGDAA